MALWQAEVAGERKNRRYGHPFALFKKAGLCLKNSEKAVFQVQPGRIGLLVSYFLLRNGGQSHPETKKAGRRYQWQNAPL